MPEPIRSWDEWEVRSQALQQRLAGEVDLATCEQALGDLAALLTYLRACQQMLEGRRHELSLGDYRAWRRCLRTMRRALKAARYQLLEAQALHLHRLTEVQ